MVKHIANVGKMDLWLVIINAILVAVYAVLCALSGDWDGLGWAIATVLWSCGWYLRGKMLTMLTNILAGEMIE